MTPHQFIGIGVRLFAVWLALSSIRYLSSVPAAMAQSGEISERIYQSYIVGGAYLIAAVVLWVFPITISHRLIPKSSESDHFSISAFSAARVGCALIGLWLFSKSAINLVWFFFSALSVTTPGSVFSTMSAESRIEAVVLSGEVVLAVLMVLGSNYFARLVIRDESDDS